MSGGFADYLDYLDEDEWEERPVDIETFVQSKDYLGLPPLSKEQYKLILASTQVYKHETLIKLYGEEEGDKLWKQTVNEVIAQLGKGCHAPYTPIFSPESGRWHTLDSLGEGNVVSSDGKSHYSTESFKEGRGQMVRVRTALGFEEDVYVGHEYLSYKKSRFYNRKDRGNTPQYYKVDELSPGDRVAISMGFDVDTPVNIPLEHAELIGYWLGDGAMPSASTRTLNMDFCSDEVESIKRYEELCQYLGDSPTKTIHKAKNLTFFRHGANSKAVILAREFGLEGLKSKTKFIPDAVWASNNEVIAAVVAKLWQTDGCVYSKNGQTAEFVSVSVRLATDMQKMLLRLGIPSALRFRTPKSNFANASEAGYVTVSSQESINAFGSKIKLLDHKKVNVSDKGGRVYSRLENGLYFDRIVSIDPLGEGDYWTRTVPDTGNYLGNGMVSRNSGKDYCSTIAVARIVYLLLCLKDPSGYFGKPPGDAIDILNIAINAQQARNVFFKGFKTRIDNSPWFQGKYNAKADAVEFDKNITCHSGHSERESWEGYNVIVVILDEISGFAIDNTTGHDQAKTAQAIYKMYRGSVMSRFPEVGKIVLLSFPRFKGDFIQQRYDAVVAQKETTVKDHTFKINEDFPDGVEENEFSVHWEEDRILSYRAPKTYAVKRPTWDINPLMKIDHLKNDFHTDPTDALSRFACMPPDAVDAFFKSREKIEKAFSGLNNPFDDNWRFRDWFKPLPNREYYIHVDLAHKHDRASVAMAHVETWSKSRFGGEFAEPVPLVKVDCVRWWTPKPNQEVSFSEIRNFIITLRSMGFDIKLVTFDRWQSIDTMNYLREANMQSEGLSVAKRHYEDLAMLVQEERIKGYYIDILIEELLKLRIMRGDKVDHPRKGCFVGDTRIPLLDGTRPMISELAGKEVWVYSATSEGKIVPGRARGRYTKHVTELVDVILDSGAVVRCTPEHLWMLRNGEYKEAKDLRPGIDRLMPINQIWPVNGGYERVTDKDGNKVLTHHMVVNGMGLSVPEGHIVHHKNHIKTDNRPDNLEIESLKDHSAHHTSGRHDDEDYRAALYAGLRKFNSLDSTKKMRSEHMKSKSSQWYCDKARRSKTFRADITIDSLINLREDSEATNANSVARILGCGRNVITRVLKDHGYSSWEEFVSSSGVNHKVRAVVLVKLDVAVPVYDLEVDGWSNFALSAGVFVHNSKDLADSVCGAVYNAVALTVREQGEQVIEVSYLEAPTSQTNKIKADGPIKAPPGSKIPDGVGVFLKDLEII